MIVMFKKIFGILDCTVFLITKKHSQIDCKDNFKFVVSVFCYVAYIPKIFSN